jgi:peptidoglycan/LPS O-acetylase OafA/YrhL
MIQRSPLIAFSYRQNLMTEGFSCWLDHFRWLAALAVAAAHLRNILFPDFNSQELLQHPLSISGKIFYFFTLFGEQSVVVFFVMSGLLVGGSIFRLTRTERLTARTYAIDRTSRLLVALIPAIILSVGLQWAGLTLSCTTRDTAGRIAGNLLFLQNFTSQPLCNDHPLWSLSSEGWFYITGPLLIVLLHRFQSGRGMGANARLAGLLALTLLPGILAFSPIHTTPLFGLLLWTVGLLPWFVEIRLPAPLLSLPLLASLLASRSHWFTSEWVEFFLIALSFALLLCAPASSWKTLASPFAKGFAACSYSLYLIHMPLAQMAGKLIGPQTLSPHHLANLAFFLAILTAIAVVSWAFGHMFEARTRMLRQVLRHIIPSKPAA